MDRNASRPLGLSAEELLRQDRWLRALVRGLVGESEVDDVVQDTWASALRRGGSVERPRAWLSVAAGNFVRRARRSVRRRAEREEAAARPDSTPTTEETLELLELQQHVMRAVRELREPYRTTVLLRYTHGLSFPEIAARTGANEAAVRQRLKRGLDALRAEVRTRWGDDWRALPGLAFWLLPGVVEMKKTTAVTAAALVAASLGALAIWGDLPFGTAGTAASEPAARVRTPNPEPARLEPELEPTASDARTAVAPRDLPAPEPVAVAIELAGHVLDVHGDPLAGVGVAITSHTLRWIRPEGLERPAVATTTAGDGSFRLAADPEQPEPVTGPGWVPVALSSARGGDAGVVIVAAPALVLAGLVTDAEGVPLAGVTIEVEPSPLNEYDGVLDGLRRTEWLESRTDGAGRFQRRDLPAEMGRLRFSKEGFVTRELDIGAFDESDLRVTLEVDAIEYVVTGWVLSAERRGRRRCPRRSRRPDDALGRGWCVRAARTGPAGARKSGCPLGGEPAVAHPRRRGRRGHVARGRERAARGRARLRGRGARDRGPDRRLAGRPRSRRGGLPLAPARADARTQRRGAGGARGSRGVRSRPRPARLVADGRRGSLPPRRAGRRRSTACACSTRSASPR